MQCIEKSYDLLIVNVKALAEINKQQEMEDLKRKLKQLCLWETNIKLIWKRQVICRMKSGGNYCKMSRKVMKDGFNSACYCNVMR